MLSSLRRSLGVGTSWLPDSVGISYNNRLPVSTTGAGYIYGKILYIGFNLYSIFRCVFLHNMFMKDGLAKDVISDRVILSCGGDERFLRAMM